MHNFKNLEDVMVISPDVGGTARARELAKRIGADMAIVDKRRGKPGEVAEMFEVPLSFLLNKDNHERHSVFWRGKRRAYYAMPYQGHYIWGATAGMIRNLHDRVCGDDVRDDRKRDT